MRTLLFLVLLLVPFQAIAQGTATLVADDLRIEGADRLVASGNIEVLYADTRLTANQIIYSRTEDRLEILGPIRIETGDGSILIADQARLDPTLENGLLRSARLVIDRQLQLAANRIDRRNGRYNQLYKTTVTSCQVCGTKDPLWDIRAERVVHDEDARQLYFTNAVFRIRGVPVLWLPRVRLPDPTLNRATGFLIPSLRTTNQLGTGLRFPYFIAIGDHRDLTLTPYVSPKTRTLQYRYRQAFLNGDLEIRGSVSDDTLERNARAYVFAEGQFDISGGFQLDFDIEAVSDRAYLLDYGFSDKDRLDTAISLTRVRNDELIFASATYFESLRDDEANSELPPLATDFRYERRLTGVQGGAVTLAATGDALFRGGDTTGDAGRDMLRIGLAADWQRNWVTRQGLLVQAGTGASADAYRIWDDPDQPNSLLRVVPHAELVVRYPLSRRTGNVSHLLEPVVELAWSDVSGDIPPNEDSTRPEFDTGNLLVLNRFPGEDAVEEGFRAALGLSWSRKGSAGGQSRLTFGRVIREAAQSEFTPSSGLQGTQSDWLIAGQLETGTGLRFEGRALLEENFEFSTASARANWSQSGLDVAASYIWQAPDPILGRNAAAAAWAIDTRVQLSPAWAVEFDARYDVDADTPTRAGLGLQWQNECVTVDLSVSRRYTSTTTVAPSTNYGLSVSLTGFSAGRSAAGPRAQCNDT